jgi:uncharacterized membrane protein YraQ (UPF0718 family)
VTVPSIIDRIEAVVRGYLTRPRLMNYAVLVSSVIPFVMVWGMQVRYVNRGLVGALIVACIIGYLSSELRSAARAAHTMRRLLTGELLYRGETLQSHLSTGNRYYREDLQTGPSVG